MFRKQFQYIFLLIMLAVAKNQYKNYDAKQYFFTSLSYTKCFASQDLKSFIFGKNTPSVLSYYTASHNKFTEDSIITTSDADIVGTNRNLSLIFSYSRAQLLLRIFSRSGSAITLTQSITPSPTACSRFAYSSDGSRIVVGCTNALVSYVYDGSQFVLDSNNTVASINALAMSPDGMYVFIGTASGATAGLRIYKVNLGSVLTEVLLDIKLGETVAQVSNPILGVYDVIVSDLAFYQSTFYLLFDSNLNTLIIQQPLFQRSTTNNYQYKLTQNGKYLVLIDRSASVIAHLLEKIDGTFTQTNALTNFYLGDQFKFSTGVPLYITQDSKTIITTGARNFSQLYIFFSCDVQNCATCSWTDICQTCNNGFQLINNVCHCLIGNISLATNSCVQCNVPECYQCNYDNICSVYLPASSSTQQLVIILVVFVIILIAVSVFIIYKIMKITSVLNSISTNSLLQLTEGKKLQAQKSKIIMQNNKQIQQSRDQLNQQSNQTLNQINQVQVIDSTTFTPSFTSFDISTQNFNSNVVKVKQRKKRANLKINIKDNQIEDITQQIGIQDTFKPQIQEKY